MNEPCLVLTCERCGSECRLTKNSVRSNAIICPVCMDNEIDCCSLSPTMHGYHQPDDIMHNTCPYVTDSVALSTN